jgi:hypothetical protein
MSERNYIEKQDILNLLLYLGYEFKNPYYIEILSNYMLGALINRQIRLENLK